ncbi:MAG: DUF72 domain-containing protein [Agriterribacter sp.]
MKINKPKGSLYIGTSNIVLAGSKGTFPHEYKDRSRLYYYSTIFNSVEINATFYKTPLHKTFRKWAADTTSAFKFSVKFPKTITHSKKLAFQQSDIHSFLQQADGLGEKKGCLLIQLPGKITLDYFSEVDDLLHHINQDELSGGWKKVIEFRDGSWDTGETLELLDGHHFSMVHHDHAKIKMEPFPQKSNLIYVRCHGPMGNYRGSYEDDYLRKLAARIHEWSAKGKQVYVYFNNTIGDAFHNAKRLMEFC